MWPAGNRRDETQPHEGRAPHGGLTVRNAVIGRDAEIQAALSKWRSIQRRKGEKQWQEHENVERTVLPLGAVAIDAGGPIPRP